MKTVLRTYALFATLLAAACQAPTEPGIQPVSNADLAIEYAVVGGLRLSDGPLANHLRIAFDGRATYDERFSSGEVTVVKLGELGADGIARLDSLFSAQRFLTLTVEPDSSSFCLVDGGATVIAYRAMPDTSMHSLTDTGCFQSVPVGFTVLRYTLRAVIEDSLEDI
ncbi:MAG: hypothetical protein IH971_03060 [Candidatus Marinimicrobia bacterium]|nr:hypothetical protein [Candidatus Neomarinimicrobiota bacterium]